MASITIYRLLPLLGAVAFITILACGADDEGPAPEEEISVPTQELAPHELTSPPPMTIDPDKKYTATIVMEKGGEIVIELFAKETPKTVNSFVFLARSGFYDGVTFHRVIAGFMAQTGDPSLSGGKAIRYSFENEFHTDRRHAGPGVVSMANRGIVGGRATNGSQFFITYTATLNLDGLKPDGSPKDCTRESCHAVFGNVVSGMDVVNGITVRDPGSATSQGDVISSIRITES
jgi:cyclophilin family peptidyl-prolyl cis-trans isomerase